MEFARDHIKLFNEDCIKAIRQLPDNSIDSIVTDPPYGLSFMGKHWDYDVPSVDVWREVYRVLKPGGYLLSFGGTRTYHRMACAIEDAGFEIRDMVEWLYGSGFPKSLNVGDGWGTALKPAHEPICMARKPLSEKTVAENVLKHGTGGINIDGCRVGVAVDTKRPCGKALLGTFKGQEGKISGRDDVGRFPANVIHDGSEVVVREFPCTSSGKMKQHINGGSFNVYGKQYPRDVETIGDSGSTARFFYCAKASKSERDFGLDEFALKVKQTQMRGANGTGEKNFEGGFQDQVMRNVHPTVKPVALMRYLCRMVTPKGGIVLDPFMGSGTTGIAAKVDGYSFIGIEREEEYCKIAEARIMAWKEENIVVDLQQKLF